MAVVNVEGEGLRASRKRIDSRRARAMAGRASSCLPPSATSARRASTVTSTTIAFFGTSALGVAGRGGARLRSTNHAAFSAGTQDARALCEGARIDPRRLGATEQGTSKTRRQTEAGGRIATLAVLATTSPERTPRATRRDG